jgi:hypothetical protein
MEGLREPLDDVTARLLRLAVREHALGPQRYRHRLPAVLHAGTPGQQPATIDVTHLSPPDDVRIDMVAALRVAAGTPDPWIWLTREAGDGLQDVDARWLSAARSAYAEAALPLVYVVVTRRGWWDPRSDLRRSWARIR